MIIVDKKILKSMVGSEIHSFTVDRNAGVCKFRFFSEGVDGERVLKEGTLALKEFKKE